MSLFDNLPEEEIKKRVKLVILKLQEKSTPRQKAWYRFSMENIGFEFLHKTSGKRLSKIDIFDMLNADERLLNLATLDVLDDFSRKAKLGYVVIDYGSKPLHAITAGKYRELKRKEKNAGKK